MCCDGQPQLLQVKFTYDWEENWNNRWATWINIPLVGISIVDTWLACKLATGTKETHADFYLALVDEIKNNTYNLPNSARTQNSGYNSPNQLLFRHSTGITRVGIHTNFTPKKRRESFGVNMQQTIQSRGIGLNVEEKPHGTTHNALTRKMTPMQRIYGCIIQRLGKFTLPTKWKSTMHYR